LHQLLQTSFSATAEKEKKKFLVKKKFFLSDPTFAQTKLTATVNVDNEGKSYKSFFLQFLIVKLGCLSLSYTFIQV
jgi:hypothetical protein